MSHVAAAAGLLVTAGEGGEAGGVADDDARAVARDDAAALAGKWNAHLAPDDFA